MDAKVLEQMNEQGKNGMGSEKYRRQCTGKKSKNINRRKISITEKNKKYY